MKKHNGNTNNNGQPEPRRIHFEFSSASAESVAIDGTFNNWHPAMTPMVALGQGRWVKDLMLMPGHYEYRLLVDGVWMQDPQASETVPNPFGERNSVLKVKGCAVDVAVNPSLQKEP